MAIKGHRKEHEAGDSGMDEEIDAELKRHSAIDSEDEKNTRHIKVSTSIGFSAKKRGAKNAFDADSAEADS